MCEPIQWSRNPELWAFRSKRLKLQASIAQSRAARLVTEKEQINREYQRLRTRWRQLVKDGEFATTRHDAGAMHRIANQIAAFYRDFGIFETRVDSVLNEVAQIW